MAIVPNLKPVPNNLTEVRFGPVSVDFTVLGTTVIGELELDEMKFIPHGATVVFTNALGTNGTQAVVAIDDGTTGENLFTAQSLPATPVSTGTTTPNLSQAPFAAATNGYVLGCLPVGTTGTDGAAATQSVRVNVTTAAIPQLASTNRVTAANISTITVAAIPAWLVAGVTVNVLSMGNAGYNGTVPVIAVTGTTFSYYNSSVVTEASTADTAGRIGALTGDVYVRGLLF